MADAPTPFWLVWSPDGERPPRFQHTCPIAAGREADRLAQLHRGHKFYVLAPLTSRVVGAMERESFLPLDDEVPF